KEPERKELQELEPLGDSTDDSQGEHAGQEQAEKLDEPSRCSGWEAPRVAPREREQYIDREDVSFRPGRWIEVVRVSHQSDVPPVGGRTTVGANHGRPRPRGDRAAPTGWRCPVLSETYATKLLGRRSQPRPRGLPKSRPPRAARTPRRARAPAGPLDFAR